MRGSYGSSMLRAVFAAGLAVLALAGCTDTTAATMARTSPTLAHATAPTTTEATPRATPEPTKQATPAYSQHQTGPGCPRTSTSTPRTAVTARIADVDNDGRDDIEWAYMRPADGTLYFGVTTASGATISTSQEFASGAYRRVVITRLRNHAVIALPSDAHGIPLFSFANCAFHRPIGVNGRPYQFGQGDLQGDGIGAGCRNGQLVGLQNPQRGTRRALTATTVLVSPDGRTATNGPTTTVFSDIDAHPAADQEAQRPTCDPSPVLTIE
ncbi:hypothetical protein [Amnibacterium kyonggiense]